MQAQNICKREVIAYVGAQPEDGERRRLVLLYVCVEFHACPFCNIKKRAGGRTLQLPISLLHLSNTLHEKNCFTQSPSTTNTTIDVFPIL